MEKIGCTTPFGLKLDNICTEKNKSRDALWLFYQISANQIEFKDCPYPCQFLMNRIKNTKYEEKKIYDGLLWLVFDKYIKITKSTYSYNRLELLAELGGYFGLFLGLSVFDLRLVFNKIFNIFMSKFPMGRDSATFWDNGTKVPPLSRDKGTTGQAKKSCQRSGRARTEKI